MAQGQLSLLVGSGDSGLPHTQNRLTTLFSGRSLDIAALGSHGVRFLAVSQSIDTDQANPTARLLLHILASVAEFERELIRERVCAGVRNAKRKGKVLGRKRAVFDRHRATEMHRAGASVREIARTLEVSVGTIRRLLKSAMANQNAQRPQSDMR
jgi:DNA invertase Pin-like site-specific DNA recombinase